MRHPNTADQLGLTDIQRRHPGHDLLTLRIFLQHNTLPLAVAHQQPGGCPQELPRGQANLIRVLEATLNSP